MPDHLTASSVEDLLGGCVNIQDGYPDAAEYTGDGPHTIAIFAKSLVSDASLNGTGRPPYYELENSNAPEGLLAAPASPRDVALLACGDALPGREQLNTCSYESVIGMGRYPTEVPRLPRPVRGRHQGVRQGATGGTGRAVHAHRDRAGAAAPLTGPVPWR